jgi:hypothetical protein
MPTDSRHRDDPPRDLRFALVTVGLSVGLFLAMLVFLELGRHLGILALERYGESSRAGVGSVDGAVYSLLALLMGFTFSGAATRYTARQEMIVHEVAAIDSAWRRLDTLPAEVQAEARAGFRRLTDALIAAHPKVPGSPAEVFDRTEVARAQRDLWTVATTACLTPEGEKARMLVLPALNEMFGIADREHLTRHVHPPKVIFVIIGVMALAASLFAGYGMASASPNWFHMVGTAGTIAIAAYIILELEFPHRGLIRVGRIQRTLVDLRAKMD